MIEPELAAVFVGSTVRLAAPLLLAATGELVSERAGVLNMSVEGMMLTGAFAGAVGSWATGSPLMGLALGVLCVLPVAWLQAFLSITLRANQIVNRASASTFWCWARPPWATRAIFGSRSRAEIPGLDKWAPPGLADLPVLGEHVFRQTWLLYAALVLIVGVAWVMRSTSLGPGDSLGRHRTARGRQLGLAGQPHPLRRGSCSPGSCRRWRAASSPSATSHTFTEGMTSGAGYLAIAAVIFGNWRLGRTLLACVLFGGATALQFQLPAMGVDIPNALLIMLPYVLGPAGRGRAGGPTDCTGLTHPTLQRSLMEEQDVRAYVNAAARVLGLPLDEAQTTRVATHLQRTRGHGRAAGGFSAARPTTKSSKCSARRHSTHRRTDMPMPLNLSQTAQAVAFGQQSAVDVLETCIARIESHRSPHQRLHRHAFRRRPGAGGAGGRAAGTRRNPGPAGPVCRSR